MSNSYKHRTEGGSGGKRGHSNMEHREYTEEIQRAAKSDRRHNDARILHDAKRGIYENDNE